MQVVSEVQYSELRIWPIEMQRRFVAPQDAGEPVRRCRLAALLQWHANISVACSAVFCRLLPIVLRDLGDVGASKIFESLIDILKIDLGRRRDQHETRSMIVMPGCIGQRNEATEGSPDYNRSLDP